jgi:hypothetical protein
MTAARTRLRTVDQKKATRPKSAEKPTEVVLRTMKEAADALRARIGRGSPRMLRDWIADGMPGKPGRGTLAGHFPIEAMVAWAQDNLDLNTISDDEHAKTKAEIDREKLRKLKVGNEEIEARRDLVRGNSLPRDEWTLFAREVVAIFQNRQMRLGKRLAQRGVISKNRIKDVEEEVRKDLAGLAEALKAGPPKDSESD